jgi:hypothetical protein
MRPPKTLLWLTALLLLPLLACGPIPEWDGLLGSWAAQETRQAVTPVPGSNPNTPRDYITFQSYTYRTALSPGESVPGTQLLYVGPRDRLYEVQIDGQTALKSGGDSFNWQGMINAGVFGEFFLRLTPQILGEMLAAGQVNLTILNPIPTAEDLPLDRDNWHVFPEMVIDVTVPVGGTIPGTSLTYEGLASQGAQIGNMEGYPYLAQADSLRWVGRLGPNAFVVYNLRVISSSADSLRLGGFAELWIRK